jgi:3-hydroxymyristoyl/3-hydroxydecanoyl-(acyl carrier protein) dehydratase
VNAAQASEKQQAVSGPMISRVVRMGIHDPLTMETELDPKLQPFLHDHQIEGTPVLPGVMGLEAFAEAALSVLPGWHVESIENIDFSAPFKFYRGEPRTVTVQTRFRSLDGAVQADCVLIGQRTLINQAEPLITRHFTGSVRLTKETPAAPREVKLISPEGSAIEARDIYRVYFHGPAYQVLERAWWDGIRMVGRFSHHLPANHQPADRPALVEPRLIELCFQTAGLWEMATQGRLGLPLHIDQVRVWPVPRGFEGELLAAVIPIPDDGFDAQVVDAAGNRYVQLRGYRTIAVPKTIEGESLNALQSLISLAPVAA